MTQLPPEDRPDTFDIGPVRGIPIHYEDDPRFEDERAAWSAATRIAQSLHSADELLSGLRHEDWRVRHETVDRLIARAWDDTRTLPSLIEAALSDPAWEVSDAIVMRFAEFDIPEVIAALRKAVDDPNADVRWAAAYALSQHGLAEPPPPTEG